MTSFAMRLYGVDWSEVDPATAERVHEAYVAGHPVRLQRFFDWLDAEGFDVSALGGLDGFDALEPLHDWIVSHPGLPGLEPLSTKIEAIAEDGPRTSWWPYLEGLDPAELDFTWLQGWWLSDEALEFCSGVSALISEILIEHCGNEWRFSSEPIPVQDRNQTTVGFDFEGNPFATPVERKITEKWLREWETHYGPDGSWEDSLWSGYQNLATPEILREQARVQADFMFPRVDYSNHPGDKRAFTADVILIYVDHDGNNVDLDESTIDLFVERLKADPSVEQIECTSRSSFSGYFKGRIAKGTRRKDFTALAEQTWKQLCP